MKMKKMHHEPINRHHLFCRKTVLLARWGKDEQWRCWWRQALQLVVPLMQGGEGTSRRTSLANCTPEELESLTAYGIIAVSCVPASYGGQAQVAEDVATCVGTPRHRSAAERDAFCVTHRSCFPVKTQHRPRPWLRPGRCARRSQA